MGLFDNVDIANDTVQQKDFVRGSKRETLPSNVYNLLLKAAYGEESKSGAVGINVIFEVADGDYKGETFRVKEWVTSGTAKGKKTYYERKTEKGMEKVDLPGFSAMNTMSQLLLNKDIFSLKTETKTIKLWNRDQKAEVPTDVPMFIELLGKGVSACVLNTLMDSTTKNTQTGEYEPNGKTYALNIIDHYLDPKSKKTLSERNNNVEADLYKVWLERWKDQIDDQTAGVKNAGAQGVPSAATHQEEKAPLFG